MLLSPVLLLIVCLTISTVNGLIEESDQVDVHKLITSLIINMFLIKSKYTCHNKLLAAHVGIYLKISLQKNKIFDRSVQIIYFTSSLSQGIGREQSAKKK